MKKIITGVLLLLMIFSLSACGASGDSGDVENKEELFSFSENVISMLDSMDDTMMQTYLDLKDEQMDYMLKGAQYPIEGEDFKNIVKAWQTAEADFGAYQSHGEFSIVEEQGIVKVTCPAQYADRDVDLTFSFDKDNYMTSFDVNGHYSKAEIAKKAGLNTLLGMGTVFVVLIIISLVISLFNYLPGGAGRKPKKKDEAPVPAAAPAEASVRVVPAASAASDEQLVAVIAAAIAAATGTSTDGFVVRSIKRRSKRS